MTTISEADNKLNEFVERFVREWINGTRNENIKELKRMNPFAAAYVCSIIGERLGKNDRAILITRLHSEALSEMAINNW